MNKQKIIEKRNKYTLLIIILAAFLLRSWNLSNVPPSLTPDEASLGYNAYSILKTGKDEYGTIFPVVFKSFGDYKPGLYVYLSIPFVFIFGLNEISVRIPSVLAGTAIVYLIYLLMRTLFPDKKNLAIVAAFVSAISPYLIYFSRGAWEANVSLALTLAGIYFFLKAFNKQNFLIVSAAFFGLTLIAYQGAKYSSFSVILILFLIYFKELLKMKKLIILKALITGLLISLPVILTLFNGQAQRLAIFSVFSYPRPESEILTYKGPLYGLFHSDSLNYARMVLSRWFNFYSGQFMHFSGDLANPAHTPPYQGVMLLVDLMLLPVGIYAFFQNKFKKEYIFIMLWLMLAPLSAAMSRDQTNAVRSLPAAVPLIILISFGLWYVLIWRKELFFKSLKLVLIPLYLFSMVYFWDAYFIHTPVHNSEFWRYGYKQAVQEVNLTGSKYNKIYFEQSFNQPYIYFLFHNIYDPALWQSQSKLTESEYKGDVGYQTKLDNISFERTDWSKFKNQKNSLVVTGLGSVPQEIRDDSENFEIIKEIKYLNGIGTAFVFVHVK